MEKQFEHPCLIAEHHAFCKLRVFGDAHHIGNLVGRERFLRLANHGDLWNRINPVRKQFGHVFKRDSKHMTGCQASLFHRRAGKCRKSDNVTSGVDMWNVSLKELIDLQLSARVRYQSGSLQMKLIAISLAAHGVDERVSLHFLATLQLRNNSVARLVDSDMSHRLRQTKRNPCLTQVVRKRFNDLPVYEFQDG